MIFDKDTLEKKKLSNGEATGAFNTAQHKTDVVSDDLLEDGGLDDAARKKMDEINNLIDNRLEEEEGDECRLETALKSAQETMTAAAADASKSVLNNQNLPLSKFAQPRTAESRVDLVRKNTEKAIERASRRAQDKNKHKHPKPLLAAHLAPKPPEVKPQYIKDREEAEAREKSKY